MESAIMQNVIDKTNLESIIECPVCKEIPFPPIFNCLSGHFICCNCRPKIPKDKCVVCRVKYGNARNFALEQIILGSSFTCPHKGLGCNEAILGQNYDAHLSSCQFNAFFVLCNEKSGKRCKDVLVSTIMYLKHLKTQHDCVTGTQKDKTIYGFVHTDKASILGQRGTYIHSNWFEKGEDIFLQKWAYEDNLYYSWVCLLNANVDKLDCFAAKVTVCRISASEDINEPVYTANMNLHDPAKEFDEVKYSGSIMAVLPCQVTAHGGPGPVPIIDGKVWTHCWKSEVQIRRKLSKFRAAHDQGSDVGG